MATRPRHVLTAVRLRELLEYDQVTGIFRWLTSKTSTVPKGRQAGGLLFSGHIGIRIDCRKYLAHRLAWLYVTGEWPKLEIDHINGCPSDNRFSNLRCVSHRVNCQNLRRATSKSKHGVLGVSRNKDGIRWNARIHTNSKVIRLGTYATPEEAHAAYISAKRQLHEGNTL